MNRRRFNENLKRQYRSEEGEPARAHHSSSYHRYFEGYEEYRAIDEKGHAKIIRKYVGTSYERDVSRRTDIFLRILYWALYLAACSLFAVGATRNTEANRTWYFAVLQFGVIVCFIWMLKGLFNCTTVPKVMTIGDYKSSSVSIKHSTFAAVGALLVNAAATVVLMILNGTDPGLYAVSTVCFIFASGIVYVINRIEFKIKYSKIPYMGERNPEASEIEY